jgi:curved DNA-binding protein CbpA
VNPYEVLGVGRDASAAEIRTAYRRLAKRNHPDLNRGGAAATRRFQEIGEAYATLSNPERRAAYDLEAGYGIDSLFEGIDSLFEAVAKARTAAWREAEEKAGQRTALEQARREFERWLLSVQPKGRSLPGYYHFVYLELDLVDSLAEFVAMRRRWEAWTVEAELERARQTALRRREKRAEQKAAAE